MVKPIRPEEVGEAKIFYIPDVVFVAFNEAIAAKFTKGSALVYQEDVLEVLTSDRFGLDRREIFKNGWLNVEEAYRESGWTVYYDKPGYNEDYKASFKFTKAN